MTARIQSGARVYSRLVLAVYDWWVLGISNRFAWRCSTRKILLPFFEKHVGERHLDVGVGTGFYLSNIAVLPRMLTLLDLNKNSLDAVQRRLRTVLIPALLEHDAMLLLPPDMGDQKYDAISLFYLLHCLPGNLDSKERVFANLKHHLAEDGILFGATILGDAADHNVFGQRLMSIYNQRGIFGNRDDTAAGLQTALKRHFLEVHVDVIGAVALFTAKKAR